MGGARILSCIGDTGGGEGGLTQGQWKGCGPAAVDIFFSILILHDTQIVQEHLEDEVIMPFENEKHLCVEKKENIYREIRTINCEGILNFFPRILMTKLQFWARYMQSFWFFLSFSLYQSMAQQNNAQTFKRDFWCRMILGYKRQSFFYGKFELIYIAWPNVKAVTIQWWICNFPDRGGGTKPWIWGENLLFDKIFVENWMKMKKMKEIGSGRGGDARP